MQRQATGQAEPSVVPPIVHDVLRSPGQLLDPATRAFMEPRFGHDFGRVRVHTDARAAASARAVNAVAFTVGRDIVFDQAHFEPHSASGAFLLAHELVHTLQQGLADNTGSGRIAELQIGAPNDRSEAEADAIAAQMFAVGPDDGTAAKVNHPALFGARPVLARYDCSKLKKYSECITGAYKCGYGGSGTCGWVGPSRGGCVCVGAARPPIRRVLAVLAIIGLSVTLLATVIAALLDPEPVTKLGLAGLSSAQIGLLLMLLGYEEPDASGPRAAVEEPRASDPTSTVPATQEGQVV